MTRRFMTRWNTFFFSEEVPYGMALVRFVLPLVLLFGVLRRWGFVRELYSLDGSPTPLWVGYGASPLLPEVAAPLAVALFAVLTVSLMAVSVGWRTRLSLIVACVLYPYFGILDAVGTLTKYTVIGSHVLLLLALSDSGAVWSADEWFRRRSDARNPSPAGLRKSPVWPRRLLQLLVGLIYLGAAFTKMHTPAYFSGDQLTFWMLADMNFENPLGGIMSFYPPLLTIMAYVTIIWEVLFVFLVFSPVWRLPALAIGVVFHILTYFTLGLIVFPLLFLGLYFVFVEPSEAERAAVLVKRTIARWGIAGQRQTRWSLPAPSASFRPAYSLAAWGLLMATAAVASVEIEHRRDVYGEHSANGPLPLKTIGPKLVKEMLGPSRPLRPQDMYFAFDVGTKTLGGQLSDSCDTFTHGERAIVQCSLQPPHPDMWVEANLHDADDHLIKRIGSVVPREDLRAEFYYLFDESFLPGEYDFVLRFDGVELTRRRVTLEGQTPALTASR